MVVSRKMLRQAGRWTVNVLYGLSLLVVAYIGAQVFLFSSFKIPSDSMAPELRAGDQVMVSKLTYGPRLFNLFASLREEQVRIYRAPGMRKVKRNDVVVFNLPYPNKGSKVEMHILKYYIKRCVGLPGDSLEIQDGWYRVRGVESPLGNVESQQRVALRPGASFEKGVYRTFPSDSLASWNIKDFGPLYIPGKGDILAMTPLHYLLYKKLIEWEQQAVLTCVDSVVYLNNQPITSYQFLKNYYFMAGDYTENSRDSRYWGLLPEEYIVGKAWIIWKSVDPSTGQFNWKRMFKAIQ